MVDQVMIAQAPAADWDHAEREARRAAGYVAMFVGVPAAVAAGAALVIFALTWLVLVAPLVAAVLTWMAWRYGRPEPSELRPGVVGPRRATSGDRERKALVERLVDRAAPRRRWK